MQKLISHLSKKIVILSLLFALSSFVVVKYVFYKNDVIFELLFSSLNQNHYAPLKLDDAFSEKIFDSYLNDLDYNKKLFLQSDVDDLRKYRLDIDNEITSQRHEFYKSSIDIINKRIQQKENWSKEILSKPLDYTVDEEYETDGKKTVYVKTEAELKKEWEKMIKYQVLFRLDEMMSQQEKAIEKKRYFCKNKILRHLRS